MSERGAREWRFYFDDMIAFAEKVLVYSEGFDHEAFFCDSMRCDAPRCATRIQKFRGD
jgi:uncharacterized protein with HEPN domain